LIEYLKCTSGVFVYSVGMPPAIAASTKKALDIMHREPERVVALQRNCQRFRSLADEHGLDIGTSMGSAVCPIMVADSLPAVVLSQRLLARGINALPIIYPAVPAKASRLRFFITSNHTDEDIQRTVQVVAEEVKNVSMKELKIQFAKLQQ
jgi:7-keto-8-aminopelargonate synthetase-like enzyme